MFIPTGRLPHRSAGGVDDRGRQLARFEDSATDLPHRGGDGEQLCASLPLRVTPNGRAAAILAKRRGLIALAGAAALAVAMLAYVLH